jgi:hypothetical protein
MNAGLVRGRKGEEKHKSWGQLAWHTHLVDTAQRRDIHGLTTDNTSGADAGGILTWAAAKTSKREMSVMKLQIIRTQGEAVQGPSPVDDGVHQDLDGVLVCEQLDDLKGVLDNADLHIIRGSPDDSVCTI